MLPVSFWRSHGRTERQFSSFKIIKHRMVTKNFSGFFLLWVSIYELEQFGSRAVPAHLPVFNIVRNPNPNPCSRKPGTRRGPSRTARAVQSCV
jgi:hypothetical protein